jgi:hypothetical protein
MESTEDGCSLSLSSVEIREVDKSGPFSFVREFIVVEMLRSAEGKIE